MAFDPNGLSDVAALNRGRTLFEYGTRDPLATVLAAGYFDAAHGLLTTGDSILVSADDGEAIVRAAIVNGGAVVAVSQGGAGTANLSITANALGPGSPAQTVTESLLDRVTIGPTGHQITSMWSGTQAEYDALGSYSSTTLYVVAS